MATSCKYYYGKLFAHLAGALTISAVSAETSNIGNTIYGNTSVLIKFLANLAIMLLLLQGVFMTKPGGVPKYVLFIALAFWLGQLIQPYVRHLEDKGTLIEVLAMTAGVFGGMMALGFYDSMNILGFGPYLIAGLIGLIIVRFAVYALGTPEEKQKSIKWLNMFAVALFAVFTAYDVQVARVGAAFCRIAQRKLKIDPDYPVQSLGLYLDFLNIFVNMDSD
jgi:hypothetical protein